MDWAMNWAGVSLLDHIWRSPGFPMWLTLAAAGFFAIVVLITLLRAEKSVANGALSVITLLAVGIAVAAITRGYGPPGRGGSSETRTSPQISASLPALSCIDDLAGDIVLAACEKALFGSPESAAAAVTYAASQINRLTALGDASVANRNMTPELQALRHAMERDRFGLAAQVLVARDHCTPTQCAAFRSLTDQHRIASNMEEHVYEAMIARYSPTWNVPSVGPVAVVTPTTMATGRPTNAEFPSAASTPAVSIMAPEPTATTPPRTAAPTASAPTPPPKPPATANAQVPVKKPPAPKPARAAAPVQIAPAAPAASAPTAPAASAPAASND
jgi:hypothetical protein